MVVSRPSMLALAETLLLLPSASALMLPAAPHLPCRARCGHFPACSSITMVETEPAAAAASSVDIYDEFLATDVATGERKKIELGEKEKLYLDCLEATYFGGDAKLGDEEFDQLKVDLDFEGSQVTLYSKQEVKFLIANKNYRMGNPTMDDKEYDALRRTLKDSGSPVVLHEAPTCRVDTGVCKMDMRVDEGKQRLLYFPGTIAGLVLFCELLFWTLGTDPILSIIIASVPSYFFGGWFTENVFAQKPLVTNSACPECNMLLTVYFGDLFGVQTDSAQGAPTDEVDFTCSQCKKPLKANRADMIVQTLPKAV